MFKYEKEMIPVLVESLSKIFNTDYITTEFSTGNGIADLVFTTKLSEENLFFNDYGMMSLFVNLFQKEKRLSTSTLYENCIDKTRLRRLLNHLEEEEYIYFDGDKIIQTRKYKPHTEKLFSIEAKLKDWKSGLIQASRYKFFSHQSYLAYPQEYIHRVDTELLTRANIGLISVELDCIDIVYKPKTERPQDVTSFFFLSELFAQKFKPM